MSSSGSREPIDDDDYRRQVYRVRDDDERSMSETLDDLLSIGCEYLGVENGHIKRIDERRGIHHVIASVGEGATALEVGARHEHGATFCRRTVELDSPLAITHASEQGWAGDPAYQSHGLECYLGATSTVEGTTYGTVCFVSRSPHDRAFTPCQRSFVELVAGVVGTELEAARYDHEITDTKRLNAVLNRILRHDLRNTMNSVVGYTELLADDLAGRPNERAQRVITNAESIVEMGETARKLQELAQDAPPPTRRDLGPILEDVAADLHERAPEADVEVSVPSSQPVVSNEHLQAALYELGENAIDHAEGPATLEVSVDTATEADDWVAIEFEDDGPGLPGRERRILRGEKETQLEHSRGLGLWFVYWTVFRSGGELTVDVDDGTTIRVRLYADEVPTEKLEWFLNLPVANDLPAESPIR